METYLKNLNFDKSDQTQPTVILWLGTKKICYLKGFKGNRFRVLGKMTAGKI